MWKVTNARNQAFLSLFEQRVIVPLLDGLVEAKTGGLGSIDLAPSWAAMSPEAKGMLLRLRRLVRDAKSFQSILNQVLALDVTELTRIRALHSAQNRAVEAGQFNLPATNIPSCVKEMFVDFFYEKFFNDSPTWIALSGASFSKRDFVANFKEENREVSCCPYCDLDTTNCAANNIIEHFLPKAKYPLLSMCAPNMIAACTACNTSAEGKGARVVAHVTSPSVMQIGDTVLFEVDSLAGRVLISAPAGRTDIDGYLDLLSLRERWGVRRVYEDLTERFSGFISTGLHAQAADRNELLAYFEAVFKRTPMFFAARSLVNEVARYRGWI